MIRGLIAFLTSKALWNPATLFGLGVGVWAFTHNETNQEMYDFFKTDTPWIACAAAGFVLTYLFKKPYKTVGRRRKFDLETYLIKSVVTALHCAFTTVMMVLFVFSMAG